MIFFWNVRGLNKRSRRKDLKELRREHKFTLACLLETKVKDSNSRIITKCFPKEWGFFQNYYHSPRGRIWILWDPVIWKCTCISSSMQCITIDVSNQGGFHFILSVVYASNMQSERSALWTELCSTVLSVGSLPWIVGGDFNCIRNASEKIGGRKVSAIHTRDFNTAIELSGLQDLRFSGSKWSWSNNRIGMRRIFAQLDRILANSEWIDIVPRACYKFIAGTSSDHLPMLLSVLPSLNSGPKPFRFFNHWYDMDGFRQLVSNSWNSPFQGNPQFVLVSKLKLLKANIKNWLKTIPSSSQQVALLRKSLVNLKDQLHSDPMEVFWHGEESRLEQELHTWLDREEKELQQKSRDTWLKLGDRCTKFFFKSIKCRQYRNDLSILLSPSGDRVTNIDELRIQAPHFFQELFNQNCYNSSFPDIIVKRKLTTEAANWLSREVAGDEVLSALKAMNPSKAPGPDGFNGYFFLHSWDVVGPSFTAAVLNFFNKSKLLKEVNHTFVTLIPKLQNPTNLSDFRPISCCNVIYKVITKILSLRLQSVVDHLVSSNQHAFIKGRNIGDCSLLAHELVKDFKSKHCRSFCLKIDLKKAFDSLNREFLCFLMTKMGFTQTWVDWLYECISSPTFSIMVNGSPAGFFGSNRGVRQGDPISPYLFVIAMEFLSIQLDIATAKGDLDSITKRGELCVSHLLFADDLLIFGRANAKSLREVDKILHLLASTTGLTVNRDKSKLFFSSGVVNANSLAPILNIPIGVLPIRYLGLPLSINYLKASHYSSLIDKCRERLEGWAAASLSYSGRIQLINSSIMGLLNYWVQSFYFPKAVIKEIERLCAHFLWGKRMHSWSWSSLCTPKKEGGLGIRRIEDLCKASQVKQVWRLLQGTSVWAQFLQSRYLKDSCFWNVTYRPSNSLAWKKLLQTKELIYPHVFRVIGSGETTNLWFDPWLANGSVVHQLGADFLNMNGGYNWSVSKLIVAGQWQIPSYLHSLRDQILAIHISDSDDDRWLWTGNQSGVFTFSSAWNSVRVHYPLVRWVDEVWFPFHCPKMSCCMVRAIRNRLPTANKLYSLNLIQSDTCYLCDNAIESSTHLFFQCSYARYIWALCRLRLGILDDGLLWTIEGELDLIKEKFRGKTLVACLARLALSASVWFLWKERNMRVFHQVKTHKLMLFNTIANTVRILLLECKWRVRRRDEQLLLLWDVNPVFS